MTTNPRRTVPMTLEAGQRIGINCQSEASVLDKALQTTIDGEVILEIPNDHPDDFDRIALFFQPTGDEADFAILDSVTARAL